MEPDYFSCGAVHEGYEDKRLQKTKKIMLANTKDQIISTENLEQEIIRNKWVDLSFMYAFMYRKKLF